MFYGSTVEHRQGSMISDPYESRHVESFELTCRCGTNFMEGLLFVRDIVYCKMSGEYEVAF